MVDEEPLSLFYRTNGSNARPMAPTCAESSDMSLCEQELEWLMKSAGFSEVTVQTIQRCAIIKCKK